ncbi:MAG: type I-MYXAN CRISPR-associated protein Cas6/Cmx6 [Thermoguttaceae bacterium]|nr:type I-MYXAN CRISPR-associated protein Cas6/Cmx6 [Thermoguttaceae bacterium]
MKLDVCFTLSPRGTTIPADHGYAVFSAISRILPEWHEKEDLGILPICGVQTGNRQMFITEVSRLSVRIDADRIAEILPLAGKRLGLGRNYLQVGVPTVHPLTSASSLRSRLVTIKGFPQETEFREAVRRQLNLLQIAPETEIVIGKRRTLAVHDQPIVGFEVFLTNLSEKDSVSVQENGIGGRRKMGCGLFLPTSSHTLSDVDRMEGNNGKKSE